MDFDTFILELAKLGYSRAELSSIINETTLTTLKELLVAKNIITDQELTEHFAHSMERQLKVLKNPPRIS